MRYVVAAAFSCVLGFSLTSCGGGNTPELRRVEKRDMLILLRADKSEILDPHATNSGGDSFLIQQMYETLVQPSKTPPVKWEPCLAESWEISPDFKTYTFTLRKGVKFHDGADFNAAAAKRSFERASNLADKAAPAKLPYAEEYFGGIASISVIDDYTIRFSLMETNPKFLASCGLFAASIVSPKAIATLEGLDSPIRRQSWLNYNPAGTGPYTIAAEGDYANAENINLTSFEGYWDGKPALRRVAFRWNEDQKIRREQLISDSVQMIDNPAGSDWADLRSNPKVVLHSWDAENLCYLGLNTDAQKGFPTSDVRVRKAISLAIDRDALVRLYEGTATPHHVLLPPSLLGFPKDYKPTTDIGAREERLAKARSLLKESGQENLTLKLLLPAVPRPYLSKPPQIADLIRNQLGEIGITVELERQSMKELGDNITNGNAPLVLIGWMGETGEPDDFWRPLLSGRDRPSDSNVPRFWRKDVADRIDAALKEPSLDKRAKIYWDLEKWVHEEFRPMVPLLTAQQSLAWSAEIEGIYVDSTGTYRLGKARYK